MHTENIIYQHNDATLEGYLVYDPSTSETRPAVLIAHAWAGRDEFACNKAEKIAELGYVGFTLDMFGKDVRGDSKEECSQLIQPFVEDRLLLRQRMQTSLELLQSFDVVDTSRIAAIGFCFGGLCALDLARSGADIKGVVSLHGLLFAAENLANETIKAKILALHGHDDPMVPPQQVADFQQEMTTAGADWQVHVYGNTKHAFTKPDANDPDFGTVYNPTAELRSWQSMRNFFTEIFD